MTVILGKNRFVDCHAILGFDGRPLLKVIAVPGEPLAVNLYPLPADARKVPNAPFKTIASGESFGIFTGDDAIVTATRIAPDLVHLHVDLRAVGMNIYDDVAGLHIGGSTFAENEMVGAAIGVNLS